MTFSISMSDEEYKFISEYAAQKNISMSDFIVHSVLEQIEDEEDLKLYEQAKKEFDANPVTYSHKEVKELLGLAQ